MATAFHLDTKGASPLFSTHQVFITADLTVPEAERAAIREVAANLGLASRPPHEAVMAVKAFFLDGWGMA